MLLKCVVPDRHFDLKGLLFSIAGLELQNNQVLIRSKDAELNILE